MPRRLLGQLCPVCKEELATVEMRIGPVYAKVGERCVNSGMHLIRLLGKLTE